MPIDPNTPREDFTIAKHTFQVYKPYTEGHVLTEAEAKVLNQTYAENIRNNFASTVKSHDEAGTFDQAAMQASLDEYMGKYEFGVRVRGASSGPRAPRDPVLARAIELAKAVISKKIREAGGNIKDYKAADISERARKAVDENPRFKELAQRQLNEESEMSVDVGGLDSAPGGDAQKKGKAKAEAAAA